MAQRITPFAAAVSPVKVQRYDMLQPGRVAVTIQPAAALQARILASHDVVTQLHLGQGVTLGPANRRARALAALVTEIADPAPTVSAFPVVVTLRQVLAGLDEARMIVVAGLTRGERAVGVPFRQPGQSVRLMDGVAP